MLQEILDQSITRIVCRIHEGAIRPSEIMQATLDRIHESNPALNALIEINPSAMDIASDLDSVACKDKRPMLGIPITVKDLIRTRDLHTSAGSKVFGRGLPPELDALVVRRLREAGAVIVGKAHLHEFAFGVTNENAHFGPCRNPWDPARVSGGSSGGSAVSVAAGMCLGSIGTDTRGSIRIPSAACGMTGLKPTLSRVPTDGVLPLSWTMDHVGPISRSVEDTALIFSVMTGESQLENKDEPDLMNRARQLRIGVNDYFLENLDPDVEKVVQGALDGFRGEGYRLVPVPMKHLEEAHRVSSIIAGAEAAAYHENFIRTRPDKYDPAVLQRLQKGFTYSATDLVRALQTRLEAVHEFDEVFRSVDCLIGAAIPCRPPRIGEDFVEIGGRRLEVVESLVRLTAPQNVAGVPALVLPCGFTGEGLPVGLQLIGGRGREKILFALGEVFQRWTDWHLRKPGSTA